MASSRKPVSETSEPDEGSNSSISATNNSVQRSSVHYEDETTQSKPPLTRFTAKNRRKTSTIFHVDDDTEDTGDGQAEPLLSPIIRERVSHETAQASTEDTAIRIANNVSQPKPAPELVSFMCGLSAGVIQAGLFNPFDRALYLSVTNERPFIDWRNFHNPYIGFMQSVGHRALSGGLYFPLENIFCRLISLSSSEDQYYDEKQHTQQHHRNVDLQFFQKHPALANFVAGTLAGTSQALIVNPISALKYKSWSRDVNRGMVTEAIEMFQKGGIRPFCNGLIPTVIRDLVFGGTYTFLRLEIQYHLQLRQDQQWGANMIAAAMATVLSGPFNLARNVQYATRSRKVADGVLPILKELAHETSTRPSLYLRFVYVQSRLRIGWGTARVAIGMSFGQVLYDKLMGFYEDNHRDN